MLLHVQKPGSQYVTTAADWAENYGRSPKPGARPLVILRPFGPVAFVYELNDTEGKPLPQPVEDPFVANGEVIPMRLNDFIERAYYEGIIVSKQNYGTDYAGQVQIVNKTDIYKFKDMEKRFRVPFAVTVNYLEHFG